jgi:hypothetical protein
MNQGLLNLSFGSRGADSRLIRHKKGQFFIIVAILYCIILVGIASYVISVISSPPMARVGGAQYAFLDVKAQSTRVVEVSLANLTNGGPSDILSLNLENWKDSTQSFCTQQGFSLDLEYGNVWNTTNWNQTLSWSKARVNFTLLLQSGVAKINDEFTVQTELYVNIMEVTAVNSTHSSVNVMVWREGGSPVIQGTVTVQSIQASDNGDGTYTAIVPSATQVSVSVLDSKKIRVDALWQT